MQDTLGQIAESAGGIPDQGTRIMILVTVTFVLTILCVLFLFKLKEVDSGVSRSNEAEK